MFHHCARRFTSILFSLSPSPPLSLLQALGGAIKEKFGLAVVADSKVAELMRGIRSQMSSLIEGLEETQLRAMQVRVVLARSIPE